MCSLPEVLLVIVCRDDLVAMDVMRCHGDNSVLVNLIIAWRANLEPLPAKGDTTVIMGHMLVTPCKITRIQNAKSRPCLLSAKI
jgi:hypothetical protein